MLRGRQIPFGEPVFGRIVDYGDPADGALYEASMMEQFDSARELLHAGAGVHYRDPGTSTDGRLSGSSDVSRGLTALHWAAFYGEIDLVRRLVESGADVEATDSNGRRPLVCAAINGHAHVVEYLLKRGADLHAMDYSGWTMIPSQRRSGSVVDTIQRFADGQDSRTNDDDYGTTHLREGKGVELYQQGLTEQALAAFSDAIEIFERLPENPDDEEMTYRSASAHNNAGSARLVLGQFEAARQEFLTAAGGFGALWEQNPSRPEFGNDLAAAMNNLGRLISFSDKPEGAERFLLESLRIRKEVGSKHPSSDPPILGLLETAKNLFELYERLGMTKKAKNAAEQVALIEKQLNE